MKLRLQDAYAQAPFVQRIVREVTDELLDQNVIFLFPRGSPTTWVASALTAELHSREFAVRSYPLEVEDLDTDPLIFLGFLHAPEVGSVGRNVAQAKGEPDDWLLEEILLGEYLPDIFLVRSRTTVKGLTADRWIAFTDQWARLLHKLGNPDLPRLCLLLELEIREALCVQEDVTQTVRWWWGISWALDTRLICRNTQASLDPTPENLWREHLMPSLCSGDPRLVAHLWDRIFDGVSEVHAALSEYASTKRHWVQLADSEDLPDQARPAVGLGAPPASKLMWWSAGLVVWSLEYGTELHTAWLAFRKEKAAVSHRIWRGQTPLLLPLLDQVRLRICERLTDRYSSHWVTRWHPPVSEIELQEVRSNPLACQWGHLGYLFENVRDLRSRYTGLINLVHTCRQTRNDLAHHRPIPFERFRSLWNGMQASDL